MDRYASRDNRKKEILLTALGRWQCGKKTFTTHQMAKAMGLKPSTHLRKMLAELVEVGDLEIRQERHRPNVVKNVYKLSQERRAAGMMF